MFNFNTVIFHMCYTTFKRFFIIIHFPCCDNAHFLVCNRLTHDSVEKIWKKNSTKKWWYKNNAKIQNGDRKLMQKFKILIHLYHQLTHLDETACNTTLSILYICLHKDLLLTLLQFQIVRYSFFQWNPYSTSKTYHVELFLVSHFFVPVQNIWFWNIKKRSLNNGCVG